MITYTAGYKIDPDGVHAEVLDFPGVMSCGADLAEAREMLADALVGMAEICLDAGEALPRLDPSRTSPDFDVIEPIRLSLTASADPAISGAVA
jgi:predicted RNase H-like HicB family nuclease